MNGMHHESVLAIDIGGSKLQVGVVDSEGHVLGVSLQQLTGLTYSRELILQKIRLAACELEQKFGRLKFSAVGVSVPGPCDPIHGVLLNNVSTGIGPWHYAEDLREVFFLPVFGDNDVNACAVAEKRFGSCKDTAHFMWVTLSFGCGGAFFLNNELYRGVNNLAGEVGHIQVEHASSMRCGCGVLGDMEIEGAGFAIGRKYLERTGQKPDPTFSSKEVSQKARTGDMVAIEIFRRSGYYLGKICSIAQNMLNLEKSVIGGGVAVYDFDLLKPGIDEALEELVFPLSRVGFTVEKTALGYYAALLGAAALALNQ